jgi:hypothetical protein
MQDRLEAYPTLAMVGCEAKPALPTLRQEPLPARTCPKRNASPMATRLEESKGLENQRKKGYLFRRLLATNEPKPNSVPITIMLGSGTVAAEL